MADAALTSAATACSRPSSPRFIASKPIWLLTFRRITDRDSVMSGVATLGYGRKMNACNHPGGICKHESGNPVVIAEGGAEARHLKRNANFVMAKLDVEAIGSVNGQGKV